MDREKKGISLQTLIVASLASGAAALVTSQFWEGGKVVTAIFTPIIVTLVSELLHRPAERISSATVRRPAVRATSIGAGVSGRGEREATPSWADGVEPGAGAQSNGHEPAVPPVGDGSIAGPRRIYSKRRPVRLRLVLAAGLAAFVIGAAVVTIPELVAGEAIGGGSGTTLFSGGSDEENRESRERSPDSRGGDTSRPEDREPGGGGGGSSGGSERPAPESGGAPKQEEPAPERSQPPPSAPTAPSP